MPAYTRLFHFVFGPSADGYEALMKQTENIYYLFIYSFTIYSFNIYYLSRTAVYFIPFLVRQSTDKGLSWNKKNQAPKGDVKSSEWDSKRSEEV